MDSNKIPQDPRNEQILNRQWGYSRPDSSKYKPHLLITGATTALGVHALTELLKTWPNEIHVLINADTIIDAKDKLASILVEYDLSFQGFDRIVYHLGETTQSNWGLKIEEFTYLKQNIGYVLHLALSTDSESSFNFYRKLWIPELEQMIEFCSDPEFPKALHYDSSYLSNFLKEDEDFKRLGKTIWHNNYASFKWLASKVINNAFDSHLRGAIYDIPMVLGSLRNGLSPSCNSAWKIIDIFVKSGTYCEFSLKISSIDVVAKMMAINICNELVHEAKRLIRPVLDENISDWQLKKYANKYLPFGLRAGERTDIIRNYPDPDKVNYLLPKDYKKLLKIAQELKPIYPVGVNEANLPDGREIFLKNLFFIYGKVEESLPYSFN